MRTLRVFAPQGDFEVDIPDDAKVTFGYFNPASHSKRVEEGMHAILTDGRGDTPGWIEMKRTALRIYGNKGEKDQLACFTGVSGFRDTACTFTPLTQRATFELAPPDEDGERAVTGLSSTTYS